MFRVFNRCKKYLVRLEPDTMNIFPLGLCKISKIKRSEERSLQCRETVVVDAVKNKREM